MSLYRSTRPWLAQPPKVRLALLHVSYYITNADGDRVELRTWVIGVSPVWAWRKFRESRPWLTDDDCQYTIATESKGRIRDLALGDRVEVEDPLLESTKPC